MGLTVVVIALRRWQNRTLRPLAVKFLLGIAVVPVLWLAYNRVVYGNALEFANGPYSAKAIEQRVGAPNPALHNAGVAAIYFLKSAQLNMSVGNWGRFWLAAAVVAVAIGAWKLRAQSASMLLLWVPLLFYALSIAYGSVPLHVYTWCHLPPSTSATGSSCCRCSRFRPEFWLSPSSALAGAGVTAGSW